jgi:hypothetical protein
MTHPAAGATSHETRRAGLAAGPATNSTEQEADSAHAEHHDQAIVDDARVARSTISTLLNESAPIQILDPLVQVVTALSGARQDC